MNITIRGLNETVFRKFKARAVEEGMRLGEAVTQAVDLWIEKRATKQRVKILDIELFDWAEGTEEVSLDIDRILCGDNAPDLS